MCVTDCTLHIARLLSALYFVRLRFLANVNSSSCSVYVMVRPSVVCLSVTLVHATQAIEIFGDVSTPLGTLAIY